MDARGLFFAKKSPLALPRKKLYLHDKMVRLVPRAIQILICRWVRLDARGHFLKKEPPRAPPKNDT
jgi:hypothetical protein